MNDSPPLEFHVDSAACYEDFYALRCEATNMLWTGHVAKPDHERLKAWYMDVITGTTRSIVVVKTGDTSVGYLYLDAAGEGISHTAIGVSERFAGQGLGTRMLRELAARHPGLELRAWIYEHNRPSIRAHEKAGYQATATTRTVDDAPTQPAGKRKILYVRPAGGSDSRF